MALETLKNVTSIGGFNVLLERPKDSSGNVDWVKFDEQRKLCPVFVDNEVNMISFRIQDGPIKENGVNGCQVDTLIHSAHKIITELNKKFPSEYNSKCLDSLEDSLKHLSDRTKDRESRKVEGTSNK